MGKQIKHLAFLTDCARCFYLCKNQTMIKLQKWMFTTVPTVCVEWQPPTVQTLYMWMCKFANEDWVCRPSIATLVKKCWMSKNTVISAAKKLESINLIKKTNRCKDGEYTSNMYDVYFGGGSAGDEQPSSNTEQGGSAGDEQPSAGDGNKLNQLTKSSFWTKTNKIVSKDTTPNGDGDWSFSWDLVPINDGSKEKEKSSAKKEKESTEIATYVPKEITLEINKVIDTIKKACMSCWIIYSSDTTERMYAKHILSKKFKSECLDQVNMQLYDFLENIVKLSSQVKYSKMLSSAKSVYYNRWDVINKVKQQQQTLQSTQKRVFKY